MSAEVQTLSGEIQQVNFGNLPLVCFDQGQDTGLRTSYSYGMSRGVQIQINPSVVQRFTLVGFSARVELYGYVSLPVVSGGHFARFGQLWGGLYVNSPLSNVNNVSPVDSGGAAFPPDLSTFAQFWDGQDESVRIVDNSTPIPRDPYSSVIARNVMLPSPILIRPSSNLGFGVVLTPSLLSANSFLIVNRCSYSVLYTTSLVADGT